ncbi:GlsB/YeaQ/YmgE family stress response membrane protein [Ruania alkalisoli]|uniref:GlsB/YeaQ/YmgE family stress response membrane protein n=1 Tax=Ruania alkalisoli TaxID=2779775 RepID=A0A7M1SU95_9MICO|nr:GlsB/YeaQ/YmgE family stress response membrane protein [Ruania alkalisoli]QOR70193.1 GlsB/YeaQ/YmgE family stress response membrane protein [Ruania alkalisoli]
MGEVIGLIVFGAIVGVLARLFKPGEQKIGVLWTILVGIAGALIGYLVAGWLGVDNTSGIDWIRLAISVVAAIVLLGVFVSVAGRKKS